MMNMEKLRSDLLAMVDSFLADVAANPHAHENIYLQLEAVYYEKESASAVNEQAFSRKTLGGLDLNLPQMAASTAPIMRARSCDPVDSSESQTGEENLQQDRNLQEDQARKTNGSSEILRPRTLGRKSQGGLRLRASKRTSGIHNTSTSSSASLLSLPSVPTPPTSRQCATTERQFPKRRKICSDQPAKLEKSTIDKLIEGIWEQIHRPQSSGMSTDPETVLREIARQLADDTSRPRLSQSFVDASQCCQQITSGSRTGRALEVLVQARWIECYQARLKEVGVQRPHLKAYEVKKVVLSEACQVFQWSEKELRNRIGIWKGYCEIKNEGGWVALVFSGPGLYRFCKYRIGFDSASLSKLRSIRSRLEVAADTLQPLWRRFLPLVGQSSQIAWRGHPHDWVVSKSEDPVPLAWTYRATNPEFSFVNIEESTVDRQQWPEFDPRRVSTECDSYICEQCTRTQSRSADLNECECFGDLYGPNPRGPPPVQIFATGDGRQNGLLACSAFERGVPIGEFVGLVTKGLVGMDVMQHHVDGREPYQIWQGQQGNFTRFVNHSCQPNSQFVSFTWLGIQRVVLMSKGIAAGREITVDYSSRYWNRLDKVCLCNEARCRYKSGHK